MVSPENVIVARDRVRRSLAKTKRSAKSEPME
jgi:hypothetical protein